MSDRLFIPKGYNVRIKVSNWTEWQSPAVYLDQAPVWSIYDSENKQCVSYV